MIGFDMEVAAKSIGSLARGQELLAQTSRSHILAPRERFGIPLRYMPNAHVPP